MNHSVTKYFRILAISPSTSGFGFVVLEGTDTLVDWEAKAVRGNKNEGCLGHAEKLFCKYEPNLIVLYDHAKNPKRSERIRELNLGFIDLAKARKIKTKLFSREYVDRIFFPEGDATKYKIATMLAERVPEELASKLPPKRREWNSEDRRMDIFDALALAVTFRRSVN